MHNPIPIKHTNVIPTNIDHIPPNTTHSDLSAMLYVLEAVIKMIIKGPSPTMRHVSRTHRVALDWLFDRINLDPKIQIRFIDTTHQLADILTKGNFTRDEWNNLLHLFNISHISSTCCALNFCLISCSTMAKKIQEQKEEEERVLSKSRPAAMNLSSSIATSSSSASSPIASESLGMPTWKRMASGLARAQTCVCANTFHGGVAHAGRKGELTSCRGTVQSAWPRPPVSRTWREDRAARKGKWSPRGTGTTVLTCPGSAPR